MADRHFRVELPEDVLAAFGWQEAEVPYRVREALAMELVRLGRLSEARAAELLGLNRWELLDTMTRYRVPVIRMSPDELDRELRTDIKTGNHV